MMAKRIRGVLVDLSGTIHIEDQVIAGAIEAIGKLQKSGLLMKFATNTTKESRRKLHERLTSIGFDIKINDMFTSLTAARDYLVQNNNYHPYLMIHEDAKEDFDEVGIQGWNASDGRLASSVVVGLAPEMFNYDNVNTAMRILHAGGDLLAIHKARYYKTGKGDLSLGPGPFVTALEHASDVKAHVVGKPTKEFFDAAVKYMSEGDDTLKPQEVVMIGDDVKDDVIGAQAAGLTGILVKTGKYRPGDEEGVEGIKPDHVSSSIVEAVDVILENLV